MLAVSIWILLLICHTPRANRAYLCPTDAMFPSDPAAAVMVVSFSHGAQSQLKNPGLTNAIGGGIDECSACICVVGELGLFL